MYTTDKNNILFNELAVVYFLENPCLHLSAHVYTFTRALSCDSKTWPKCFVTHGRVFRNYEETLRQHRILDSLVVECWLRVREVPGSIPSQGPRHTKDVIKMVPGSSLVKHSTLKKRNTGFF